jgi:phage terminase small subunit
MSDQKLTEKQARFIAEYLIDLNATKAAIRAGYSEKTAQQQGSRLLLNVVVAAEIKAKRVKLTETTDLTIERVRAGLIKEAEREGEGASHSARVAALAHLGKHLGMFIERHEHTGADGGPVQVIIQNADAELL